MCSLVEHWYCRDSLLCAICGRDVRCYAEVPLVSDDKRMLLGDSVAVVLPIVEFALERNPAARPTLDALIEFVERVRATLL